MRPLDEAVDRVGEAVRRKRVFEPPGVGHQPPTRPATDYSKKPGSYL